MAATLAELISERAQIDAKISELREADREAVKAQILAMMAEYELTPRDLGVKAGARRKPVAVVRFRNPATGETWSGRGRAPRWIGKNPEKFRVAE